MTGDLFPGEDEKWRYLAWRALHSHWVDRLLREKDEDNALAMQELGGGGGFLLFMDAVAARESMRAAWVLSDDGADWLVRLEVHSDNGWQGMQKVSPELLGLPRAPSSEEPPSLEVAPMDLDDEIRRLLEGES